MFNVRLVSHYYLICSDKVSFFLKKTLTIFTFVAKALIFTMKILVTGGVGFIGSHTVIELFNAGFEPIIIDTLENSNLNVLSGLERIAGKKFTFYHGDCRDKTLLREIFGVHTPEAVIHFAAYKAVGESVEQPLKYYDNNVNALLSVLDVMLDFQCNTIVFSSSCTVYGQPQENPVCEGAVVGNANSPYGYSKVICERILNDLANTDTNISSVLLRYFNPVGAHPSALIGELPNGVPNNLIPYITQTGAGIRQRLTIHGNDYNTKDGTCIRDFIHVVDLAKAHVKALEWKLNAKVKTEVFNLGQGIGNSVLEVVQAFEKVTGLNLPYVIGPRRAGDVEQIWADVTKANEVLQWKTERTIEDALRDAWKWQTALVQREGTSKS